MTTSVYACFVVFLIFIIDTSFMLVLARFFIVYESIFSSLLLRLMTTSCLCLPSSCNFLIIIIIFIFDTFVNTRTCLLLFCTCVLFSYLDCYHRCICPEHFYYFIIVFFAYRNRQHIRSAARDCESYRSRAAAQCTHAHTAAAAAAAASAPLFKHTTRCVFRHTTYICTHTHPSGTAFF